MTPKMFFSFQEYQRKIYESAQVLYQDNDWVFLLPDTKGDYNYYDYNFEVEDAYNDYCVINKKKNIPFVYNKRSGKLKGSDLKDKKMISNFSSLAREVSKRDGVRELEGKVREGKWVLFEDGVVIKENLIYRNNGLKSAKDICGKKILKVEGDVDLSGNLLQEIDEFFPKIITGDLKACNNKLKSANLKDVRCSRIDLSKNNIRRISLGCDLEYLNLSNNRLRAFHFESKKVDTIDLSNNPLERVFDSPDMMIEFIAEKCRINTLEGMPRKVKRNLRLRKNNIENMMGCPDIVGGVIDLRDNMINDITDVDLGNITKNIDHVLLQGNEIPREQLKMYNL